MKPIDATTNTVCVVNILNVDINGFRFIYVVVERMYLNDQLSDSIKEDISSII